jgi:hypothetical protein
MPEPYHPACGGPGVLAVLVCVVLTGCVYVETTEHTTSAQAALLAADSLEWVIEGVTTRQTVESTLGPPLAVKAAESGGEALVYSARTSVQKEVHVPLVLRKRTSSARTSRITFEVRDGVVVSCRREVSP